MSGYDVEHGVDLSKENKAQPSRRPDLSSFWSLRNETFGDEPATNPHAEPSPQNVTALMRMAADFLEQIVQDTDSNNPLVRGMIEQLDADALNPGGKKGLPESFFADLERIPKSKLKKDEECPICTNEFLKGMHLRFLCGRHVLIIPYRSIPARCPPALSPRSQIRPRMHTTMAHSRNDMSFR